MNGVVSTISAATPSAFSAGMIVCPLESVQKMSVKVRMVGSIIVVPLEVNVTVSVVEVTNLVAPAISVPPKYTSALALILGHVATKGLNSGLSHDEVVPQATFPFASVTGAAVMILTVE